MSRGSDRKWWACGRRRRRGETAAGRLVAGDDGSQGREAGRPLEDGWRGGWRRCRGRREWAGGSGLGFLRGRLMVTGDAHLQRAVAGADHNRQSLAVRRPGRHKPGRNDHREGKRDHRRHGHHAAQPPSAICSPMLHAGCASATYRLCRAQFAPVAPNRSNEINEGSRPPPGEGRPSRTPVPYAQASAAPHRRRNTTRAPPMPRVVNAQPAGSGRSDVKTDPQIWSIRATVRVAPFDRSS
jgi:hypothetical protein